MIADIDREQVRIDGLLRSENINDQLMAVFWIEGAFPYPWYHFRGRLMLRYAKWFAINTQGWSEKEVNDHIYRGREYAQKLNEHRKLHKSSRTKRHNSQGQ